jgi:APA family basic amino acid/polyamine antiporter
VLAAAHALSVRFGSGIQNVTTIGLVVLAIGFIVVGLGRVDLTRALESEIPFAIALSSPSTAVGLVYVSFAYSGWNAAVYVAGEVDRPSRTLPRALVAGTLLVTLLYLLLNLVFVTAVPTSEIAGKLGSGAHRGRCAVPAPARPADVALIAVALATTVSALLMTGPRVTKRWASTIRGLAWLGDGAAVDRRLRSACGRRQWRQPCC